MSDRPWLTISELARRWSTSSDSIRRAITAGKLNAVRLPGGWRVAVDEVERLEAGTGRTVKRKPSRLLAAVSSADRRDAERLLGAAA